jgi:GDP/UDP-N,N'-diacetylbacillosamine 2-epimerase (hydrolysing)
MGEISDRVFNVGCPSIDAIIAVPDDAHIVDKFGLIEPYFLLIQHPVTSEINKSTDQIKITLEALKKSNTNVLIIMPNNDAGYSAIADQISSSNIKSVDTLSINDYVNLLRRSTGLIGNSSSGIHEAASFDVPVVNIGTRQQGRLRPKNVLDVDHDVNQIEMAINSCKEMKENAMVFENLYGDGESAQKIIALLKSLDLGDEIIQKRITY